MGAKNHIKREDFSDFTLVFQVFARISDGELRFGMPVPVETSLASEKSTLPSFLASEQALQELKTKGQRL